MRKPTYYLWRNEFQESQELKEMETRYRNSGFRVVIFRDGTPDKDIHEGIKAIIKNYCEETGGYQ